MKNSFICVAEQLICLEDGYMSLHLKGLGGGLGFGGVGWWPGWRNWGAVLF